MRNSFGYLLLLVLICIADDAFSQFRSDSSGCPIPVGDTGGSFGGRRIPIHADMEQTLSPNGHWLAYVDAQGDYGAYVLNLITREEKRVTVDGGYSNEFDISWTLPIWCPYDSNRVALFITSTIDTGGSGAVTVKNLYDYNILTGAAKRITPLQFGKYGPRGMSSTLTWLPSSKPGLDTFIVGWGGVIAPDHKPFYGKYSPQTDALVPLHYSNATDTLRRSADGAHVIWFKRDTLTGTVLQPYYFDESEIRFSHPLDSSFGIQQASFSTDGKLIAYSAFPLGFGTPADSIFEQVWICASGDPGKILRVINYQDLYCKYSFWGAYPEMISDSSLVVSMHKDGDTISPLWEIATDGRILRQLTFLSSSRVEDQISSNNVIEIAENPFRNQTSIRLRLSGEEMVKLEVFNVLGRGLPELDRVVVLTAGEHAIPLPFHNQPPGVYFARLSVNGSFVKSLRMEKQNR